MDFGAVHCTPQSPGCPSCPLQETCVAFREGRIGEFPVKQRTLKVKERRLTYIYIRYHGETALHRRPSGDIWQGLYEPLNFEIGNLKFEVYDYLCSLMSNTESKQLRSQGSNHKCQTSNFKLQILASQVKHVLTHRVLYADFWLWEPDERPTLPEGYFWTPEAELDRYAVPRLIEKYLYPLLR